MEKEKGGRGGGEVEERARGGVVEKKTVKEEAEVENRVGGGREEKETVRAVKGGEVLGRLEGKTEERKREDSEECVALPLEPTVRIETR